MTDLLLEYDEAVDAAHLTVGDAELHHREPLDDARGISYAADGSVVGIGLLSPRQAAVGSWVGRLLLLTRQPGGRGAGRDQGPSSAAGTTAMPPPCGRQRDRS